MKKNKQKKTNHKSFICKSDSEVFVPSLKNNGRIKNLDRSQTSPHTSARHKEPFRLLTPPTE